MTETEFKKRYNDIAMGTGNDWYCLIDIVSADKKHGLEYLERIKAGLMNNVKIGIEAFGETSDLLTVSEYNLRYCEKAIAAWKAINGQAEA